MTPETDAQSSPWLTFKRLILVIITVLVALVMGQSLINRWNQPQVASRLQLYQTDLLLQASSWQGEMLPAEQRQVIRQGLLGKDPIATAIDQYQEVRQSAEENIDRAQRKLAAESAPIDPRAGKPLPQRLQTALADQQRLLAQLDLRIGLLEAEQGDTQAAIASWQTMAKEDSTFPTLGEAATSLIALWQQDKAPPQAPDQFQQTLDGWFRYRALEQFYAVSQQPERRQQLLATEQAEAEQQLLKLALVGTIPGLAAIVGSALLIFLVAQRVLRGAQSLLMQNANHPWEISWNWEVIWQVLVVGFFFVGQIFLPLLLGLLGIGAGDLSSRGRALYSMAYYLLMSAGGVGVLIWSLWSYRPLPAGLFQFKLRGNWWLWGLGGYLVALPLMLGTALLNQQIWQGQGGSNPLLQTVLEEQDSVALILFFLTAAVAAPLFEELLFRGFLLPSLTRYVPVWGAIALSSLIFATAHLSLSEVLPLTVLGMVLGFVYTRSRNLLAPMLLHSAWNSATMAGLFLLGGN